MQLLKYLVSLIAIITAIPFTQVQASNNEAGAAAIASANEWLLMVDEGDYENSWNNAASYFKERITIHGWKKAAASARKPLGKLLSRKLKSKTFVTQLPSSPKGEYEVIQFESSFKNKKYAIETITPMLDTDKKWRVSGYYIK